MANKNRKTYGFFATKICFFLRKKYFDVPHAIVVLVRTFVEPITPGLSQRGRLLGAVAQWQLRLCFNYSTMLVRFKNLSRFSERNGLGDGRTSCFVN